MENFYSFLSPEAVAPCDSMNTSDEFYTGVNELIRLWLKRYIEMYNPRFNLEDAMNGINSISVTSEFIRFKIVNPYSRIQENFEFGLGFLEEIGEEANFELKKLFSNKASLKEQTFPIIQSWLPDLSLDKIIDVTSICLEGKNKYHSLDDKLEYNYLWIAFSGKDNKP